MTTSRKVSAKGGNTGATYNKLRAHQKYYTQDGANVPGVTTVLGVFPKPQLMHWAWEMGLQGLDYMAVRDRAGDVGSLIHRLCECYLQGYNPLDALKQYSDNDKEIALGHLENFKKWWVESELSPYATEQRLVSEQYGFGGTLDIPAIHPENGEIVLIDMKSGKGIYKEQWVQVAAYKHLFQEVTGGVIGRCIIIRMGKKGSDDFEVLEKTDLNDQWKVFESALKFYQALKLLT